MYKHHQETIDNVVKKMQQDESVLALIIAGSITHGFAVADSDVDIMIVVSEEEYQRRYESGQLVYYDKESCTYEEGYVDGKYVSVQQIKNTANSGYEPGKFAYRDAYVAFSTIPGLEQLMQQAAQYPIRYKEARMRWFYAKFHEWYWFYNDGMKKNNTYVITYALSNMILFGGRAILAYNELLFPYHKWFLKVLEEAEKKPEHLMEMIDTALETKSREAVDQYANAIINFTDWGFKSTEWSGVLMSKMDLGGSDF